MPATKSVPLPPLAAAPRPQRREWRDSLETRTAVLEATVPALATNADIKELETRMLRWGVGTVLTFALGFCALFIATSTRIDQVNVRLEGRIDRLEEKMEARFEKIDQRFEKIDQRFEKIDQRFEKIDAKLDAVIEELRALRRSE